MAGIAIGVNNFYYGIVETDTEKDWSVKDVKRVRFLNEISVEPEQEVAKAFGDNQTAAKATNNGDITVSTTFVSIPLEDKAVLTGSKVEDGVVRFNKDDIPPEVAVVFERTNHDGSSEWLGFYKGTFTRPTENGKTKEEGIDFQNAEVEGTFIPRIRDGDTHIMAVDNKGETTNRDKVFTELFGGTFEDITTPAQNEEDITEQNEEDALA